jgi:hypothetical protein
MRELITALPQIHASIYHASKDAQAQNWGSPSSFASAHRMAPSVSGDAPSTSKPRRGRTQTPVQAPEKANANDADLLDSPKLPQKRRESRSLSPVLAHRRPSSVPPPPTVIADDDSSASIVSVTKEQPVRPGKPMGALASKLKQQNRKNRDRRSAPPPVELPRTPTEPNDGESKPREERPYTDYFPDLDIAAPLALVTDPPEQGTFSSSFVRY